MRVQDILRMRENVLHDIESEERLASKPGQGQVLEIAGATIEKPLDALHDLRSHAAMRESFVAVRAPQVARFRRHEDEPQHSVGK